MKQVSLFLIVISFCIRLQAQQGYFISIDSDDNQRFSVILAKKNYNSSSVGHLVLSNLKDSVYQLAINFPGSNYPEHHFTVTINKRDKGYQLKKNAEKGWSLQDWQTMVWIRADKVEQADMYVDKYTSGKSKDAFALMMAAVVNDTAVLFTTPIKTEIAKKSEEIKKEKQPSAENEKQTGIALNEKKTDSLTLIPVTPKKTLDDSLAKADNNTLVKKEANSTAEKSKQTDAAVSTKTKTGTDPGKVAAVPVLVKKEEEGKTKKPIPENQKREDSAAIVKNAANQPGVDTAKMMVKTNPTIDSANNKIVQQPKITQLSERWTREAREFVFIDHDGGVVTDTIKILIELAVAEDKKPTIDTSAKKTIVIATDVSAEKKAVPVTVPDSKNLKDSFSAPVTVIKTPDSITTKKSVKADSLKKAVIINSDCRNFATEADVDKLRIKMLDESDLYERIVIARKVFRTKCFTTRQINSLTELFVNDKSRYGFFDAAYPFVSDTENFRQLVEFLTDEYYINRFKLMVRM